MKAVRILWILAAAILIVFLVLSLVGRIFGGLGSSRTVGNFLVDENSQVCVESNQTIVYFFGSSSCPYCQWEEPILKNVTGKFASLISFHENIDVERDMQIFNRYSPQGYVPLIVIGCKYFRVGSGEMIGAEQEESDLTALVCSLTNGPSDVCTGVESLINLTVQ